MTGPSNPVAESSRQEKKKTVFALTEYLKSERFPRRNNAHRDTAIVSSTLTYGLAEESDTR